MARRGEPAVKNDRRYTLRDYIDSPDPERWEIIEGVAYNLVEAPTTLHQQIVGRFGCRFFEYCEGREEIVFFSRLMVALPEFEEMKDEDIANVVEPDLVVYCDRRRLTDYGARGAPDIAGEVLSPSTHVKDFREKFDLYERMGVREYWIVDPAGKSIHRFERRENGLFGTPELREPIFRKGPIASAVLDGFMIQPEELFADLD
jgi:Uma2 family endonuclease